jgi:hypothetical protein
VRRSSYLNKAIMQPSVLKESQTPSRFTHLEAWYIREISNTSEKHENLMYASRPFTKRQEQHPNPHHQRQQQQSRCRSSSRPRQRRAQQRHRCRCSSSHHCRREQWQNHRQSQRCSGQPSRQDRSCSGQPCDRLLIVSTFVCLVT